jgi:hypothetical protein
MMSTGCGACVAPTLILSGPGAIGVSVWLAMANSPLRRFLADRTLPAPERP